MPPNQRVDIDAGFVSEANSSTSALTGGATFTGAAEAVHEYASITVFVYADQDSSTNGFMCQFSTDGTNWDKSNLFSITASTPFTETFNVVAKYFRVVYTNGGSAQTAFRLQTIYNHIRSINDPSGAGAGTGAGSTTLIQGRTEGGGIASVGVTDNDLHVLVHGPTSAFGEISTATNTPILQAAFTYDYLHSQIWNEDSVSGGSSSVANGLLTVSSGTNSAGIGAVSSATALHYRPGQGAMTRFTGVFDTPLANSYQLVGIGHAESGLYFGYNGTSFGILHVSNGTREVRTLTINSASTHDENATVTLEGNAESVAVTNSASNVQTAQEIANHDYSDVGSGWKAQAIQNVVYFICDGAGAKSGTFSLSATSAAGTFATAETGVSAVETWYAQSSWSIDPCDGTGTSGINLDTAKGNVFQIDYQYLGFGALVFSIEEPSSGAFHPVHRVEYANANTAVNLRNPSMPWRIVAQNSGNTTSLSTKTASVGCFSQGEIRYTGPVYGKTNTASGITADTWVPILSIKDRLVYQDRANFKELIPQHVSVSVEGTQPVEIAIYRNANLTTNGASWTYVNQNESAALFDISAGTITTGDVVYTTTLPKTGNAFIQVREFLRRLGPQQSISIAAYSSSTTNVTASCTWFED